MARTVERFFVQSAVAQTTVSPAAVYETAANLETLPRWWFGNDPSSKMWDGTRVLRPVEDAGMVAFPGVSVDVVSSGAKNHLFGKKRWTELPSVLRFTCEIAEPDSRLRLLHEPIHGDTWRVKVSTEIKTVAARGLTEVVLDQKTVARGLGPNAWLLRTVHRFFDVHFQARNTLQALLEVAEADMRP